MGKVGYLLFSTLRANLKQVLSIIETPEHSFKKIEQQETEIALLAFFTSLPFGIRVRSFVCFFVYLAQ